MLDRAIWQAIQHNLFSNPFLFSSLAGKIPIPAGIFCRMMTKELFGLAGSILLFVGKPLRVLFRDGTNGRIKKT